MRGKSTRFIFLLFRILSEPIQMNILSTRSNNFKIISVEKAWRMIESSLIGELSFLSSTFYRFYSSIRLVGLLTRL